MKKLIQKQAGVFLVLLIFCTALISGKAWAYNVNDKIALTWDKKKAPAITTLTLEDFDGFFRGAIGPVKAENKNYYIETGDKITENGICYKMGSEPSRYSDNTGYHDNRLETGRTYYAQFVLHAGTDNQFPSTTEGLSKLTVNGIEFGKSEYIYRQISADTAAIYIPFAAENVQYPAKPTAATVGVTGAYTYTGKQQQAKVTGVDPYTMKVYGDTATAAGKHKLSVYPRYKWSDDTSAPFTLEWTIKKAVPSVKAPTGLTGKAETLLSTVKLPTGFAWEKPTTVLLEGAQTYTAKFTPTDTANYETVSGIAVTVTTPLIPNVAGDESLAYVESQIAASKADGDLKGSVYDQLHAYASKSKKTGFKLNWRSVPGAVKYRVYSGKCGNKKAMTLLTEVTGTSLDRTKMSKGTYFKYLVIAVNAKGRVISKSKTIHVTTLGKGYTNPTGVKASKSKLTVNVGKTVTIKATMKTKGKVKKHRKLAYESLDPSIATVDKKGKVKGIRPGTCKVVVYAQNGLSKTVTITVK